MGVIEASKAGAGRAEGPLRDAFATTAKRCPPETPADQVVDNNETHSNQGEAARGTAWVVFGFGSAQLLRFAFNLLLTRLLVPEVFGVMALVNTLLAGLQVFSEVGISLSIIQNRSGDDDRFLNTAWTIQALRGLLLWLSSALLAWPVAVFYQTPVLLWLIPAVGVNAAIAGFNSTSLHTLARRIVRGPLAILTLLSYTAGMAVTIVWVIWVRADVWGFVIGSIVTSLITLAVSHLLLPGFRNRICWDSPSLSKLMGFGKWVFVRTLCSFLADQTDRLVVGKVASLAILGLYQVSHQLSWMPVTLLYTICGQLVFAIYSRQLQSGQGIAPALRRIHPLLIGFAGVTATGLFVCGPTLIACLYGDRYAGSGWMVSLMAVAAFFKMLESAVTTTLMAMGRSREPAIGNAVKAVALLVLLPAGYFFGGMVGLLCALAVADVIRYVIIVAALQRERKAVIRCDMRMLLCALAIGTAAYVSGRQLGAATNDWGRLVGSAGVILILWAGVFLFARGRPWVWGWTRQMAEEDTHSGMG
jgi:O-antigen/teichoic acid export membrane protein